MQSGAGDECDADRDAVRQGCVTDRVSKAQYELVVWCNDCNQGRHHPMRCTTAGQERRFGPFRDAEHARGWVESAAINKRAPVVFELEDLETRERVKLTGFRDSDWD